MMSRWHECPYCTHKLFKSEQPLSGQIQIKCPSCKMIFWMDLSVDERKNAIEALRKRYKGPDSKG